MTRNTILAPGEYYHIYNRGVDKREIYLSSHDYERFRTLLYICNSKVPIRLPRDYGRRLPEVFKIKRADQLVDICAYCLMPNHFHILIKERIDGGISNFMQKITTAYTMYFNAINQRSGALFQGTFKAKLADTDEYLKYLIAYIHLNPVKLIDSEWKEGGISNRKKAEEFLESYTHSSYQDFLGIQRYQNLILTRGSLPQYFETPISFKENIKEWLSYQSE